MKGPGVFLVPVKPNKGLWFNWTMNSDNNTAVVPTVKGCNPITGMQTSGFHLEKYENKCPKHGCDFLHDRFCPECNYKWPPQSYVGPKSTLWWDGFMNDKDGTVRQFFFTEDELRDVATNLIGKENTMPAFGFAFFSPKERRPEPQGMSVNGKIYSYEDYKAFYLYKPQTYVETSQVYYSAGNTLNYAGPSNVKLGAAFSESVTSDALYENHNVASASAAILGSASPSFGSVKCKRSFSKSSDDSPRESTGRRTELRCAPMPTPDGADHGLKSKMQWVTDAPLVTDAPVKDVSIGAGAKINQKLNPDPYTLDTYKEVPDSVMTIYFVFQEKFEQLKAGGIRDLEGSKEGMLSNCIVG